MSDEAYLLRIATRLQETAERDPESLTPAERTFLAVWELEAEVNNGGFDQYYFNSAGDRAREAAAALLAIRAEKAAAIVERANAVFAGGVPLDRDARQEVLSDRLEEGVFEELDEALLAYPDPLSSLLATFARTHRAQIRGA